MTTTYWTRNQIKTFFQKGDEWVRLLIKGLEASGRYPKEAVIHDGIRNVLVDNRVMLDWVKNRKRIANGETVPPYIERRA